MIDDLSHLEDTDEEVLLAGRYRIVAPLGEGGMGQVFQAEHVLMRKPMAIKILRAELSEDPEMVARFQREAQAAAALDSPNVCQATDFGQTQDGSFFLVMELLQGETLQHRLHTFGPLPQQQALHITRQIARALVEAHQQGIVHRDLKPENIMLIERDGDPDFVKIMDFGIARIVASAQDSQDADLPQLTRKGLVFGTPHYMSPEQVAGEEVDHRSDLYSLGVILFEMLTGALPFDDQSVARVMAQHVTAPAPTLTERAPHLNFPRHLETLVAQLLAKGRDERPSSATEIIERLDKLDAPAPLQHPRQMLTMMSSLPRPDQISSTIRERIQDFWTSLSLTNQRLTLIAALATAATVAASMVFIFMLLTFGTDSTPGRGFEELRQSLAQEEALVQALQAAAAGDQDPLDELLQKRPDDPHLRYLLLFSDLDIDRPSNTLDEAAQILKLEPKYAHDEELMSLIASRLHTKNDGEAAQNLLASYLTPAARSAVAEIAMVGSSGSRRKKAYEFLDEHKALQSLPDWQRLSVELRQASGCNNHREKIDALQALGDPRALPTLQALQATPTTGCGTLRLQDCFGCIRKDLREAIQALEEIEEDCE